MARIYLTKYECEVCGRRFTAPVVVEELVKVECPYCHIELILEATDVDELDAICKD